MRCTLSETAAETTPGTPLQGVLAYRFANLANALNMQAGNAALPRSRCRPDTTLDSRAESLMGFSHPSPDTARPAPVRRYG